MTATTEDMILRQLDALNKSVALLVSTTKKPNLTVTEFAKEAGVSRRTIARCLQERRLRKVRGRISRDQLSQFVS